MHTPNILFIMADQLSARALGAYGHPVVQTPAIDRLARDGVVFENAYCNFPLCGPSRLSMMAGLLPHKIGAYDNAPEFRASIPTFAHYLRLGGYLTCLSGKMHFAGPDQLHGYEQRLTSDIYPSDFGWTPNWAQPEAKVAFQDMQNAVGAGPCARSMQIDYDDEAAYHANRWLFDRARDERGQPFMLTVSFTSPHDPYVARPEFWSLYRDEDIDLPAVPRIPLEEADNHSRRIRDHYGIDRVEVSEQDLRRLRHGYYAAISYVDSKVAGLLRTLRDTGLDDDTVVVFTADHGDMMGERGLFYKKTFFEWAMRVPLIVAAPGRFRPARVGAPVSLLDLLPTLHELGGCREALLEHDGMSLLDALDGRPLPARTIAGEFLAEGVHDPAFMLRDGRYKFLYGEQDPALLFDLEDDPDERRNLADDPAYAEIVLGFTADARARWDAAAIKRAVIHDQNRRRLVNRAHGLGTPPKWDFQPYTDAAGQWVRAGAWTVDVEARGHLDVRP